MTSDERNAALKRLGYTEIESAFLATTALHSGYVFRRQFAQFIGKSAGASVPVVFEKLLTKGHAKVIPLLHNTYLYHLAARPLYEAIGQGDNRNRRERQPSTIKNKLMSLDFVLAHRKNRFLATEEEKLSHFGMIGGVDASKLPSRHYSSSSGGKTTDRYFVDKYPIFLPENESISPVVSFCFVDEGLTTPSHFRTHLEQYRRLFLALPEFHLVYVAAGPAAPRWAEKTFEAFMAKRENRGPGPGRVAALLDHFAARRDFEARDLESFDREKLARFRADRTRFSGTGMDELFEGWKVGGSAIVHARFAPEFPSATMPKASFSTHLLEHNYDCFGTSRNL